VSCCRPDLFNDTRRFPGCNVQHGSATDELNVKWQRQGQAVNTRKATIVGDLQILDFTYLDIAMHDVLTMEKRQCLHKVLHKGIEYNAAGHVGGT